MFFAVAAYKLYDFAYDLGRPPFEVPMAKVWLEMARVLNGAHVADHVLPFCVAFGLYGVPPPPPPRPPPGPVGRREGATPCSTGIRWGVSSTAQMGCLRNRSGSPSGADQP